MMTLPTTPNHNSSRKLQWLSGILVTLLVAAVIGLVTTIQQIQELRTTQVLMGKDVDVNTEWIADWSAVLKVPERDQKQDSNIEELKRRVRILENQRQR